MKYEFKEGKYEGEYSGGGLLEITAEGPQEVVSLLEHFRLLGDVHSARKRLEAMEAGSYTHTMKSDTRPVYAVSGCLDQKFLEPYKDWAKRNFGYTGEFPDLEIPREWFGLKYTTCLLYTSPSPRDGLLSRMPSSA